jgi:hypothetical protein
MLRTIRSIAAEDRIPEPSPLFWDHFPARVAAALRTEPAPAERWRAAPLATWASVAAVVTLLLSIALFRTTVHAPLSRTTVPVEQADVSTVDPVDDVESDEAWAVVRAAAADLASEDAEAAGITAHPGDIEREALRLNADERRELARLLNENLKRNGAS